MRRQLVEPGPGPLRRDFEALVGIEAIRRLTDTERRAYEQAVIRSVVGGDLLEADLAALERVRELCEEVKRELITYDQTECKLVKERRTNDTRSEE